MTTCESNVADKIMRLRDVGLKKTASASSART